MGAIRPNDVLKIKKYLHGHNQSVLSIKSDADIFETPVIVYQFPDENKIVIKRAGINDSKKSRVFTLAYQIWQLSFTSDMQDGSYEFEPDESDADKMTYYLTE